MYTVELELISTTVSQSTLEAHSSSLSPSLTLSPCPVLYTRQDVTNSFVGPIRTGPQVRDSGTEPSAIESFCATPSVIVPKEPYRARKHCHGPFLLTRAFHLLLHHRSQFVSVSFTFPPFRLSLPILSSSLPFPLMYKVLCVSTVCKAEVI